jgi:hypothetical protein
MNGQTRDWRESMRAAARTLRNSGARSRCGVATITHPAAANARLQTQNWVTFPAWKRKTKELRWIIAVLTLTARSR